MALAFFSASCQQENLEPVVGNNTVTYTVQVADAVATKAIGDVVPSDMVLHYEVYRTTVKDDSTLGDGTRLLYHKSEPMTSNPFTINLELVNDQNFTVLFWAQAADNTVIDPSNLKNVTVSQSLTANQANYAAFSSVDFIEKGEQLGNRTISLVRPVSQINLGTTPESLKSFKTPITMSESSFTVNGLSTSFNVATQEAGSISAEAFTFDSAAVPTYDAADSLSVNGDNYAYAAMNYVGFAPKAGVNVSVSYVIKTSEGDIDNTIENVPVKPNYRTNIVGNLITSKTDYTITLDNKFADSDDSYAGGKYGVIDGLVYVKVDGADEFNDAFNKGVDIIVLNEDITLTDVLTRSTNIDPSILIKKGKSLIIDLNGKTLSSTSTQIGKNYNMFDVNGGTLTVKNGTMEYEHLGENMGWGASTNLFNVTAGGVLNLEGVTAKNLGGSDMGFVAHLNNWGEVTLNVDNCTLESNYVPVRVFNSGYDMNNVDIKNSTLKGGSAAFWVHNYTVADFGSEAKAEAQKALLNLNLYDQGNTFSPDVNGIRYGFTNSVRTDAYGITKSVSEDGTEVTLGSLVESGIIRRGVAGAEENTTIKKVVVEEGVTTLYDRTFRRFYALETVELPSTLTTIGAAGSGVFQSCSALKNIVLPESLTVLGKGSFQECSSLESINIPAGVTRIEADALRATGLVSVEFHEGVTYFGAQAFRDCKQLKEVVIKAPQFTVEANAFGVMAGALPGTTIYVANTEMKAYLESTLAYKNQFKIVVPGLVSTADEFKTALAEASKDIITLEAGVTYEGTFEINRDVTIVSENVASGEEAIIKGRVEVRSANPTFENVSFDRNETDSNKAMQTASNALQYKAIVMIYGDQTNKVTFKKCNFYNNNGTHRSAITNVAVDLVVDECYFEGSSSSIYSQANLSVTNSVFNYTGGNNVILSLNGCGANGGKVIFKNNNISGEKIFALSQFLSTVGFGDGTYHFDVKGNTGAGFEHYFLNTGRVANKTFADGSETF